MPSVWLSNCRIVIRDLRGSFFHSVIVSETRSSSLNSPSCAAASAAIPQKLFVPLKIGHLPLADPPFAYCSKIVRPFCSTTMEAPRLLSEYFAARAQSATRISAETDDDVANARRNSPLQ